jgi:DNA-directed RNA polymerase subunit RPC12/RpoP
MKCIHCGTNTRRKDRRTGRCPRCWHHFAFEPASDRYKLTDPAFQTAIRRVSADGALSFTPRQLYYAVDRVLRGRSPYRPRRLPWGSSIADQLARRGAHPPDMDYAFAFLGSLRKWTSTHGEPRGLLAPPALDAPAREVPPDVAAFSFDRAVVTDRAETAAMLVANRFHFEHNCAVLSADGYPYGIVETVKQMLRRNPRLTVFALHDASLAGCALPATLRRAEWFPHRAVRVVDMGLRPWTVRQEGLPSLSGGAGHVAPEMRASFPPEDVEWLEAGSYTELDVLTPRMLIRELQAAFVRTGQPGDGAYDGVRTSSAGWVWLPDLPERGGADTAATDGFG